MFDDTPCLRCKEFIRTVLVFPVDVNTFPSSGRRGIYFNAMHSMYCSSTLVSILMSIPWWLSLSHALLCRYHGGHVSQPGYWRARDRAEFRAEGILHGMECQCGAKDSQLRVRVCFHFRWHYSFNHLTTQRSVPDPSEQS